MLKFIMLLQNSLYKFYTTGKFSNNLKIFNDLKYLRIKFHMEMNKLRYTGGLFLFPKVKFALKERIFESVEIVKGKPARVLKKLTGEVEKTSSTLSNDAIFA